jgi:hypothetical protein
MGNDASNMKESVVVSQKISNICATEQKETARHLNQFTEHTRNTSGSQSIQNIKVEKDCRRASLFC